MTPKHFDELPDVLKPLQVAQFLGLGRGTVYESLRAGVIPSIKIGRPVLVPKAAIRRMLDTAGNPA